MNEYKLLYKIKSLEKQIARVLLSGDLKNNIISPTPTQMQVIAYMIEHSKKSVYQRDLEKILNLRRATVSGVLQTMEKNHLIERVIDTDDSRVKRIILNKDARKIFESHQKKIEKIEELVINGLTEEEIKYFLKILEKMQNNLKDVVEKERMKKC